jgi:hypothetical protein
MALFQNSVLKKYLASQMAQPIQEAHALYQSYFHNAKIWENIRAAKEEQFQEGFLCDLKKSKVKLSLAEEAEWMAYFNEQKAKAQALQADINRLDREIDALVYELYGLTEEEIRIVEGN